MPPLPQPLTADERQRLENEVERFIEDNIAKCVNIGAYYEDGDIGIDAELLARDLVRDLLVKPRFLS